MTRPSARTVPTAVLFDLYGTLLRLPALNAHLRLFRAIGVPSLRAAIDQSMLQDAATLPDLCTRLGYEPPRNVPELQAALDDEVACVDVFGDVMPTLRALRTAGIAVAVVSNLATPFVRPFFDHGLDTLVDTAVFSCECGMLKPDPAIFRLALDRIGATASEAIMVGDSRRCDVLGPSSIGIPALHLVRGGTSSGSCITTISNCLEYVSGNRPMPKT